MLIRTAPSRLALWTVLFAVPAMVRANPILAPSAPDGLTLYSVSSVPNFSSLFLGYSLEGITISGGDMLVSIGWAGSATQTIWRMPLVRDNGHITSVGAGSAYASVPADVPGNVLGGGLVTTAGGVLYTTQGLNLFGQYLGPAASAPLPINLSPANRTVGGMNYIPAGQTDAGKLKLSSSSGDGAWYTLNLDGTPGTYHNPSLTTYGIGVPAYSFDYLPADATFNFSGVVVGDQIHLDLYHLDGHGNPCPACASVVHLVEAADYPIGFGVVRDPVSGDILFTTANNDIWVVSDSIPEPSTMALAIGGMALLAAFKRRR